MLHIRDNAEQAVRGLLRRVAKERGTDLACTDYLDDGTPIALRVSIDAERGSSVFDFEGTGNEMIGNLNCPLSVVCASLYVFGARADLSRLCHYLLAAGNGRRRRACHPTRRL
jgi:N-methylhydantoinase B/oxoprolinase/acetone carboxylase alpha subunit